MALITYVFNAVRVPVVDFGRLIATKILGYHSHGTRLGLALHLLNGVVLALIYAAVFQPFLPGPPLVRGLTYGAALWLVMMLGVLPLLRDGFFGWGVSRSMVPSALVAHLTYGLVLGLALR
jgi:uncharacterized membrane protein YagU involved in acid resistance